jgi:uncharacterized membrane protein
MGAVFRHVGRCLVAGVVALLPIVGIVLPVVYLENLIYQSWPRGQVFYFPGLGLLTVVVILYLIGLVVGTMIGRWLWTRVDRLFDRLPILGNLYQTVKQLLGYGEGPRALFLRVVLVPGREPETMELGLVTNTLRGADNSEQLLVFIPACPNPTAGRLIAIAADRVQPVDMHVHEAMQALVALGKAGVKTLQAHLTEGNKPAATAGEKTSPSAEKA